MDQKTVQFERDTPDFTLARDEFYRWLKAYIREDEHLENLDLFLNSTLTTLLKQTNLISEPIGTVLLNSLNKKGENIHTPAYTSLKKSFAKCLLHEELETYYKQRKIRGLCYTALFASASIISSMAAGKAAGLEGCTSAFKDFASGNWTNLPALALATSIIVGFIAAAIVLMTKMNKLDRHDLVTLGNIAGMQKEEIYKKPSILDVHPFNLHKAFKTNYKTSTEPDATSHRDPSDYKLTTPLATDRYVADRVYPSSHRKEESDEESQSSLSTSTSPNYVVAENYFSENYNPDDDVLILINDEQETQNTNPSSP